MPQPLYVSVFRYPGGKARLARWIADLLPLPGTYQVYVDLFGGAANVILEVMRRNEEAGVSAHYVYNDRNEEIVNFFRVLRDPTARKNLLEMLRWTPYSRKQFQECVEMPVPTDPVEKAWRFFVLAQQSYANIAPHTPGRWGYDLTGEAVSRWLHSKERLEHFGELFRRVQLECGDYADAIRRYWGKDTLVYADPPYFPHTRVDAVYAHEFSVEEHAELAEKLNSFPGMAAVSGYCCPEYDEWYANWERHDKRVPCSISKLGGTSKWKEMKKPLRTELLWLNSKAALARKRKPEQMRLFN